MAPLSTFPSRSTSHPNPKPSYSPTSLSSSLPPPSLWISVAAPPPPHQPGRQDLVDSGVSPVGLRQMARAALELQRLGTCEDDCWMWPSITQRAYQAVEIIAAANGINCSRIVPEYSFLDARGLGSFEGKNLDTFPEVYASDSISPDMKPPPISDGTPNESVSDVFVRVTQGSYLIECFSL